MHYNWMQNEKVQILEFSFCCPLSVEFIVETIRDRGAMQIYNQPSARAIPRKNCIKIEKKSEVQLTETLILAPQGPLFGNGQGYNTPNQYQPLLSAKNHCVQNSQGSIKYKLSYCTETFLFTDRGRQHHNIIRPQNFCDRMKNIDLLVHSLHKIWYHRWIKCISNLHYHWDQSN